jgi:hypothetical protein
MNNNLFLKKFRLIFIFLLSFITLLIFFNIYGYNIDIQNTEWKYTENIPSMSPIGNDYYFVYEYRVHSLFSGNYEGSAQTMYLPFVTAFFIPISLFPYNVSYSILLILLYLINIFVIYLFVELLFKVFLKYSVIISEINSLYFYLLKYLLMFLLLVIQFLSYGFKFSLERGNYDIIAIFFSVLFIRYLVYDKKNVWIASIFLVISIHLKIYPMILFPLLFIKYRWKAVIPFISLNIIFLFILGFKNAFLYIDMIKTHMPEYYFSAKDCHSAISFANLVSHYTGLNFNALRILFTGIPLISWIIPNYFLYRRKYSNINIIFYTLSSIFLMQVIPNVSCDYKLVILILPISFLIFILVNSYISNRDKTFSKLYLLISVVLFLSVFFISRSYINTPVFLANKYPFIIILQITVSFIIIRYYRFFKIEVADRIP